VTTTELIIIVVAVVAVLAILGVRAGRERGTKIESPPPDESKDID
jgi:hypothetical protein